VELDRFDVLLDEGAAAGGAELLEEEVHFGGLRREDLVLGGEVPELALERADGLLTAGVDELDVRLAFLALVLAVGEDPLLDRLVELGREGGCSYRAFWKPVARWISAQPVAGNLWNMSSGRVEAPCWTAPKDRTRERRWKARSGR